MECNKEEAIRAKEIAEVKMQNKDYSGARRVALKAQKLDPNLENISQLLMVCDVHVSAKSTVHGTKKDWYGILKIDSTADETSIKKQYRKFAFLLHPDKNRFAGASDAFKLIGEAREVLLDPAKRLSYDTKIKAPIPPQQQTNNNPDIKTQPQQPPSTANFTKTTASSTGFSKQQKHPEKPTQDTFWTMCPYCTVKYEYYRNVINKVFLCQSCKKCFIGYEVDPQASHTSQAQPDHDVFKPKDRENLGSQKNERSDHRKHESVEKQSAFAVGGDYNVKPKSSAEVNGKRKRQTNNSSVAPGSDIKSKFDKEDIQFLKRGKSNRSFHANKNPDLGKEDPDLGKMTPPKRKFQGSSKLMKEDNLTKVKPKESNKGNDDSSSSKKIGGKRRDEVNGGIPPDLSPSATVPEIYVELSLLLLLQFVVAAARFMFSHF